MDKTPKTPSTKLTAQQTEILKGLGAHDETISAGEEAIEKAYVTGHEINPSGQSNSAALRTEFLDDEMTMLTYTTNDLDFITKIDRKPSSSTVAQYAVYLSHGGSGNTNFVREEDIANVTDPHIRKKHVNMKFVSATKRITIAARITESIADQVAVLTDDSIVNVAKTIEWASFYGDSDLSDNPTPDSGLQFDGLAKLVHKDNVIDVRGKGLTESVLNFAAVKIAKGYANPTDAFMPLGVHADFTNKYLTRQVQVVSDNSNDVDLGFNVQAFNSAQGRIRLHGSSVMELENVLDEAALNSLDAPLEPTVKATVLTDAKGLFNGENELTDHTYKVVTRGTKTNSRPSQEVVAVVANPTDGVQLEIKVNTMYQQSPQYVTIYRQGKQTGEFYRIKDVAMHEAVDGVITFVDRNENIPETTDVFVADMRPNVLSLFEFLPMTRVPMAQHDATLTFTVLWYGALALKRNKGVAHIKNVQYIPVTGIHSTY